MGRERIFNVGSGQPVTIKTIAQTVAQIYREFGAANVLVHDVERAHPPVFRYLDVSRARRLLEFTPKVTLRDGMRKTILWWESLRPRSVRAVLLDVDGTLLDVFDRYYRGYLLAAEAVGLPAPGRGGP